jgi:membrane glycosyltransferase
MDLLPHTLAWCRGEIFEGRIIAIVGLLVAIAAVSFWKFGETNYAREAVVPVGLLAILMLGTGVIMNVSNSRRLEVFAEAHASDPHAFAVAEKQRTEDFIAWYPRTRWIFFGVAVIGMLLMMYGAARGRSIGMVLLGLSVSLYVIDHFSEERGLQYYEHIVRALR